MTIKRLFLFMSVFFALTLISFPPAPVAAQTTGWSLQRSWQQPALFGVDFVDPQNGWAVGGGGGIFHTANGGQDWNSQTSNTPYDLRAVDFVSANEGWAVGLGVWHTDNGGSTWSLQKPWTQVLNDVAFFDANTGYAVGENGNILFTANGGVTWDQQSSGVNVTLYGVDLISASEGWAVGFGGTVLHTLNSGAQWDLRPSGFTDALDGVDFLDTQTGWAVGANQKIWNTLDGGATWRQQYSGIPSRYLLAIGMVDAQTGWAVGQNALVLRTDNGGASWEEENNPAGMGNLNDISFPGASRGWAVGDYMGSAGSIMSYVAPGPAGRVKGRVRLQGRSENSGAQVSIGGRQATTDAQGDFILENVPEGAGLSLSVSQEGYVAAGHPTVDVREDNTTWIGGITLHGGDVNGDDRVDIADLAQIAVHFTSNDAQSDVDGNGAVDIMDLTLAGLNFGCQWPEAWPPKAMLNWRKLAGALSVGTSYDSGGLMTPEVVGLPNGSYRMYYAGSDGQTWRILSAVSLDGLSWSREDGVRLDVYGQYTALFRPSVVLLSDGSYRMYFSARTSSPPFADICSAVSTDGLVWNIEPSPRIQHGDTYDLFSAQNASVVKNDQGGYFQFPDGQFRMFYAGWDGAHLRILGASSTDGINWNKEGGSVLFRWMSRIHGFLPVTTSSQLLYG